MPGGLNFDAEQYLVGSSIQIGVPAPDHILPQLGTHGFHLVFGQIGPHGVEEGAAVLVLGDPLAGEGAVLDVVEHLSLIHI